MKRLNRNKAIVVIVFLLVIMLPTITFGQLFTPYTITRNTGITYNSIFNNGGLIPSQTVGWRTSLLGDDAFTNKISMGFPFNFDGANCTAFQITINGLITFDSTITANGSGSGGYGYTNNSYWSNGQAARSIAPLYDDLVVSQGISYNSSQAQTDSSIKYLITGTTGNHVLIVEWKNIGHYASTTANLNFQVRCYEWDNHIEIIYGTMSPGNVSWSFSCGLNSNTTPYTTTAQLLTQQTVNTTTFSATAADFLSSMPASNSIIIFNRNTRDLGVTSLISPADGQCTYSSTVPVQVNVHNYGIATQNFTTSNTYTAYSVVTTPSGTQTFSLTINSGSLAANGDTTLTLGTLNMTSGGVYSFVDSVHYTNGDLNYTNDASTASVAVGLVNATASATTICTGQSVNLTASTPGFNHVFPVTYAPVTLSAPTTITLANDAFTNPMLPIGFNFKYFCNTYDHVSLCDNGYLTFGGYYSQYLNQVIPEPGVTNVIAFAWTDLNNPTGGTMTYQTMGSPPNRKFIINFNSVPVYGTTNITTQVILYETTNLIEMHETTVPSHNYTQGIEDATGTIGYALQTRNDATFSATNDAYQFTSCPTYSWSPGATLSDSTSATPVATPTTTTTYTVTLNPGSACTKTATVTVTVNPLPSPAGSISGPQVICAYQSGITYTCPSATNTTYYLWSVPSGSTIISGQGTTSINVSFGGNTGYISVLDSNACGHSLTYDSIPITVVSGLTDGYWIGGVSSDWFNAYNWCGAIPTSTYPPTAYIDGSVGMNNMYSMYMPIINSSGAVVNGLTMEGDLDTLTINGSNTLDVYGDWTMGVVWTDATFNPNSSTVNFKGNASQTITTYYPDMVTLTFNNLTINKGSSTLIVLEDVGVPISMTGNLSLINGLFKVTDVGSHVRFSSAPTIPSTAGLELNGGILDPGNYSILNHGLFRMSEQSSNITLGLAANNNFTNDDAAGNGHSDMQILGGNLTITGQLITQNDSRVELNCSNSVQFNNSNIPDTILINTMGVTNGTKAVFDVDATSEMQLETSTLILQQPNNTSFAGSDFKVVGSNKTILAGNTVQFGNASVAANKTFRVLDTVVAFINVKIVSPFTVTTSPIVQLDTGAALTSSGILNLGTGKLKLNHHQLTINNSTGFTPSFLGFPLTSGAIRRTTGYIVSEDTLNRASVKWNLGNTNLQHVIPFGNNSGAYIPFSIQRTGTTTGAGYFKVATYAPTTSTSLHTPYPLWPTHVTHLHHYTTGLDNSANTVNRFWQLDTSNVSGSTFTATIKFVVAAAEEPANTISGGLYAQRWYNPNLAWASSSASAVTNTSSQDTVTATGVSTFSPWTLSRQAAPLPVELLDFTAAYNGKTVDLNWNTASEINNDYFTIEKTKDSETFDFVATVNGNGNSNSFHHYYAEDRTPFSGTSYYQLTQTDFNGQSTKSGLVQVVIAGNDFSIVKTYTDGSGIINISVNDNSNESLSISLSDLLGNNILTQNIGAVPGINYIQLNPKDLPQGIYFITVSNSKKRLAAKVIY